MQRMQSRLQSKIIGTKEQMAITITEKAKAKINSLLKQRQTPGHYLRIGLQGGGCSGFMYNYEFIENPAPKDKIFEFDEVRICIDIKSYFFLIDRSVILGIDNNHGDAQINF
mgnify:CR=1 FL=1